jgi:hypothetical protein
VAEPLQALFQDVLGKLLAGALEGAFEDAMAEAGILLAHRHARGAADRRARLAGDDDMLPGRRRRLRVGAHDLHLVAVLQPRDQRHDAAVDLGADAGIADIGVDRIGEIDRRRAARQRDQAALRREAEDLVLEQFELGVFEELLGIVAFRQGFDRAAQPGIGVGILRQGEIGLVVAVRLRGTALSL